MTKSKTITRLNTIRCHLFYLIISLLMFQPIYVFAQNTDSTTPSFRGGGALAGSLLAWWICSSRRHKPIGGWLLYYVFNVFGGLFIWTIISLAALENYCPSAWADTKYYLLYLLTVIPEDILTIAELILVFGLTIKRYRSWKVVQRLRWVLALSIAFSLLSIFINIQFFESETVALEVFGLFWPVIWLLYFLKSERVKSIYRDKNFEMIFGKSAKLPKVTTFKEPETSDYDKFKETKTCENCGVDYLPDAFPDNSTICVDCQNSAEHKSTVSAINVPPETEASKLPEQSERKIKQKKLAVLRNNIDALILSVGGLLVALRLFLPPKYYAIRGIKLPYDGSRNLAATVDYQTALLQSLGIAVVTGVLFFILRRNKENK